MISETFTWNLATSSLNSLTGIKANRFGNIQKKVQLIQRVITQMERYISTKRVINHPVFSTKTLSKRERTWEEKFYLKTQGHRILDKICQKWTVKWWAYNLCPCLYFRARHSSLRFKLFLRIIQTSINLPQSKLILADLRFNPLIWTNYLW